MRSKFWAFMEACDATTSVRSAAELLGLTVRLVGFESYALVSHAPRHELRSLGVFVHNWRKEAIDHLGDRRLDGRLNPVFEETEQVGDAIHWASPTWLASLTKDQRDWVARLRDLAGGEGVTQAMRTRIVSASCSLTSDSPPDPDAVRLCMRIANYAFHHIQFLQRPQLSEPERLTSREHECLHRAAIFGERPSRVARGLNVKVSTVRTLRQKAFGRLDADSAEEAVWRMLETGQLFRVGRKSKPRGR